MYVFYESGDPDLGFLMFNVPCTKADVPQLKESFKGFHNRLSEMVGWVEEINFTAKDESFYLGEMISAERFYHYVGRDAHKELDTIKATAWYPFREILIRSWSRMHLLDIRGIAIYKTLIDFWGQIKK